MAHPRATARDSEPGETASIPTDWAAGAVEVALDAIIVIDAAGRVVHLNPAGERMFGFAREEAVGLAVGELIVMPRPRLTDRRLETQARWRGRGAFPVELTLTRSSDEPPLVTAFVRDLPQVRLPEHPTPRMERLLATAEELAHVGSWEFDLKTRRGLWSHEMYRINGLEPGEAEPTVELLLDLVHPDDRDRVDALLTTVVERPELIPHHGIGIEYRIVRADGSVREIRARGRIEQDERGLPAQWVGSGQDVTSQRVLERELLAHHAVEQALREWESFDEGVIGLLRRLGTALEFPIGSLWLWNTEQERLTSRAFWFSTAIDVGDFELAVVSSAFRPGEGLAGHAWNSGAPVIVTDMQNDPVCGNREAVTRIGLRGGVAFPATHEERPLAVLTFYGFDTRLPTERLMRMLAGIGRELGRFLSRRGDELGTRRLSTRELEVLRLAAEGNTGPQIAKLLGVSPATIKSHFENVYEKLGVGDRAAAVAYALRIGLIN
jgi:PAS domain S-box-containing protein